MAGTALLQKTFEPVTEAAAANSCSYAYRAYALPHTDSALPDYVDKEA